MVENWSFSFNNPKIVFIGVVVGSNHEYKLVTYFLWCYSRKDNLTERKNGRKPPIICLKYGKMIEKGNLDTFFWNNLDKEQFWYLGIVDIGSSQSGKESFMKLDLRSNKKMAENGSEHGLNGGKSRKIGIFRRFSQILCLKSYRSILLSLIQVPHSPVKRVL